jgi:hypothetical protein
MQKKCVWVALVSLMTTTAACIDATKSSNPLSPEVAGPMAGVTISAPGVMAPNVGAQVDVRTQPITLKLRNATTNSVRPLSYLVEVATDSGFANKIFSRDGVPQDASGQTALTVDPLTPERTYFWRARAADGANTGPFTTASFTVFTPVVFGAPSLIQPVNDVATSSNLPKFVVGNAARSGPVGPIGYYTEVSDSTSFGRILAVYAVGETANQTSWTATAPFAPGQYFWRSRAYDPSNNGPFSAVTSFRIPSAPAPPAGGGGGQVHSEAEWRAIILADAQGLNPEDPSSLQKLIDRLRAQGYAASILKRSDGALSDHKIWLNGVGWSVVSSVNFQPGTFTWDPYIQSALPDGVSYNGCGVPATYPYSAC